MNPLLAATLRQLPPGSVAAAVLGLQIFTVMQVETVERRLQALETRVHLGACSELTPPQPRPTANENAHAPAR